MHTGSECIAVETVNAQFRETTVVEARDRPAAAVVAKMNQQNLLSQGGRSLTSLAQCMADNFYVGLCAMGGHKWKLKMFLRHQMKFLSRDMRGVKIWWNFY
ncbi:hypothetical protein Tco_0967646 [Tanacetum coccineum]